MDPGLQQALQVFLGSADGISLDDVYGRESKSGEAAYLTSPESTQLASRFRFRGFSSIQEFAVLPSVKNIRWMIPIENSQWALHGLRICAPHARWPRVLKRLMLASTRVGWTGWARHKVLVASRRPMKIEALVREVTGESRPVFAFSLGTPDRFRKLTIQVTRPDGEVLGYVKLPMTPGAVERVRHETAMLERLSNLAALQSRIPRVLHAGKWGEGYILFQSAGPTDPAPTKFVPLYQDFLEKLSGLEGLDRPGRALVEEIGARWRRAETRLDSKWRALGSAALLKASCELERLKVRCGVMHGDFAPWNSRVANGELYVFDWESAELQAPANWDLFHFHVQVSSLLKRDRKRLLHLERQNGERASFLLYLLNSTCHCLQEESQGGHIGLTFRQRLLEDELASR